MQVEEFDDDGVTDEQLEAIDVLQPKLRGGEVLDLYESDDLDEFDEFDVRLDKFDDHDDLRELEETLDVKEANDLRVNSSILNMAREQHVGTLYDGGEPSRYVQGRTVSAGAGGSGVPPGGQNAPSEAELASLLANEDPTVRVLAQALMNSAHAMRENAFLLRSLMPGGLPPKFDDASKRGGRKGRAP